MGSNSIPRNHPLVSEHVRDQLIPLLPKHSVEKFRGMGGEHHKNRYQLTTKGRKVSAVILAASSADTEQLMDLAA
jgi:hypothetical protein